MNFTTHTTSVQSSDAESAQPAAYSSSQTLATAPLGGHGFAQKFGLHPGIAVLTFTLDAMLFAGNIASAGLLIPVSITAAVVLGVITFMAQRHWYKDDDESAFIKALVVTLLTAIPAPLPVFLSVPAGVVGLFRSKDR